MPDPAGLELIANELRDRHPGSIVDTLHHRGSATLVVDPGQALADPGPDRLPEIDSCVELFPTADFQEREAYDMFGIAFRGHPDLRRILMPESYVGWPQRRDFPIGGEPVLFTHNEIETPRWFE